MGRWGVSWGLGGIRYGESPNGRRWMSYSILGFRFFKYLDNYSDESDARGLNEPEEYAEPDQLQGKAGGSLNSNNDDLLGKLD